MVVYEITGTRFKPCACLLSVLLDRGMWYNYGMRDYTVRFVLEMRFWGCGIKGNNLDKCRQCQERGSNYEAY